MEDEVVYALLNGAAFDDLEWPWTTISRSQYSLKANISQTVHPIHSMFDSIGYGFQGRRIEWRYYRFDKIQDCSWRPSWNDGAVARNPCVSWTFLYYKCCKLCAPCPLTKSVRHFYRAMLCRAHAARHCHIKSSVCPSTVRPSVCRPPMWRSGTGTG